MKILPLLPRRVLATCTLLPLLVAASGLSAQSSQAVQSPSALLPAAGESSTNHAEPVTALDIFLACRHPEAFNSQHRLSEFCGLRVPSGRDAQAQRTAQGWVDVTPPPADSIREYSKAVRTLMQAQLRASGRTVLRSLPGLVIPVSGDSNAIKPAIEVAFTRLKALKDTLGVIGVQLTWSKDDTAAVAAGEELQRQLISKNFSAASIQAVEREGAGPGGSGSVSIEVRLPVVTSATVPTLRAIRFAPGEIDLDGGDAALIAYAARDFLASPEARLGSLLEVNVASDPGTKKDTIFNARVAALTEAFVGQGVAATQLDFTNRPAAPAGGGDQAAAVSTPYTLLAGGLGSSTALGTQTAAPTSTGGLSLGWENLALAATQAISDHARKQLEAYTLVTFSNRLCRVGRQTLVETCAVLRDSGRNRYLPSMETLRGLVRHDMEEVPERLLGTLLASRLVTDTALFRRERERGLRAAWSLEPAHLQYLVQRAVDSVQRLPTLRTESDGRILLALYTMNFVRRVHQGESPVDVLYSFRDWAQTLANQPGLATLADNPALIRMQRFATFVDAADNAADELRSVSHGAAPRDTVFRYALLSLLANRADERVFLQTRVHQLVAAGRRVEAALPALDSIRREFAAVQGAGEDAREQRRELYGAALANMVKIAAAGFRDDATGISAESLETLQQGVSDLLFSLRTEQYSAALQKALVLIRSVAPPDSARCDSCSNLLQQQTRLLALATDLSEAESEAQLRQAMTRFVASSGGVQSKRSGNPRLGVYLNSFVGGAATDDGFRAQLPIGVEMVYRWRNARSLPTLSLMVQAVNLGGFLPQEGDSISHTADERLASVAAPGAYFMLAKGSLPLALGAGVTADAEIRNRKWNVEPRWTLFLGVDVPLLRIR